jgi:hypothetical protein
MSLELKFVQDPSPYRAASLPEIMARAEPLYKSGFELPIIIDPPFLRWPLFLEIVIHGIQILQCV